MTFPRDSIITLPHKDLRKRSRKIGTISPRIRKVIEAMKVATLDWEASREHEVGVALAAVQIDELVRVIIIRHNFEDKTNTQFDIFINPRITKQAGKIVEDFEGCLSVSDIYGRVPRYEKVHIRALDENGKPVKLEAEGFLARVFQHEIDHINGVVFIDHIRDNPEAFFRLDSSGQLVKLDYKTEVLGNEDLYEKT